ncbi:uncharacterized protein ARMOST_16084 [Armillaria ostoyae]|uniref:HNH nuclease domain-containing protein n=1 Tax=Armillaria ostoyae TaxID=47428 RepID=A0A284RV78_ARMOS|nr:uncharacterized protein ARMOST_16084 [Armillaria ostoyae]
MKKELIEYPVNHLQAKQNALIRDNFRCVLSGAVDQSSCLINEEIQAQVRAQSLMILATQCCHIFPEFNNTSVSDDAQLDYATKAWAVLKDFGHPEIEHELAGDGVHSLTNILTLDAGG